jgi:hypothetical protein
MGKKFLYQRKIRVKDVVFFILFFVFNYSQCHSQNSYTFTNAGAIGPVGPTQGSVNAAYISTNLNGSVTVLGNGVQQWTVPATGMYKIQAIGASGGSVNITWSAVGGLGANMSGDFNLTAGQVLLILVGQKGSSNGQDGGGGGGSFVTSSASVALIVAGGGGGAFNNLSMGGCCLNGVNGPITTSGTANAGGGGTGGINGNGGVTFPAWASVGSGGGMITNGGGGWPGSAFINGAIGGSGLWFDHGGFGGGGAGWSSGAAGGGGGGYSGGGASYVFSIGGGGGGGSFNSGMNQVNAVTLAPGDGKVIITPLCITITNVGNNPICLGNSATLTTNAVSNYTWNNGSSSSSIIVSPTVTTTYTLTGTNAANCTGNAAITVTVDNLAITNLGSNPICPGNSTTLTTNAINNYTWSTGSSSPSVILSPTVTTTYTLIGGSTSNCTVGSVITLTVDTPNMSLTSTLPFICVGQSAVLSIVNTSNNVVYSWSNATVGTSIQVNPSVTTTYSVTGTNTVTGCTNTNSITLSAYVATFVVTSPTAICTGETATLTAAGAVSNYFWTANGGVSSYSVIVSPTVTTNYWVTGSSANCNETKTFSIIVNPLPNIIALTTNSTICRFEQSTITGEGGTTYTWSTGSSMPTISFTISESTTYTLMATDINGCSNTATVTQFVETCTGFDAQQLKDTWGLSIYPNPNNGVFTIKSVLSIDLTIVNVLGQRVGTLQLNDQNGKEVTVGNLTNGIYFIIGETNGIKVNMKIIVER